MDNKATIKCYQCNADVFYNQEGFSIDWDGLTWDNEEDWHEWAKDILQPIADADNYNDILEVLHIYTQYAISD